MNYYWGSLFDIDTTNENYPELIRLLLSLSDAFQVVLANHRVSAKPPAASRAFKEALKQDKVGGWSKTGDYSLPMTEGTTQPGKYCTTAIFQVSPDSFPVLEARQSLANWYLPESPEDLSFYRNGLSTSVRTRRMPRRLSNTPVFPFPREHRLRKRNCFRRNISCGNDKTA